MKSVAFCTLGCKVNQYETDAMAQLFTEKGYELRTFSDNADIYVINTCTVTNIADKKSRQMLNRARKKNLEATIVAAGCYVQAASEELLKEMQIDIVIGNNHKSQIVEMVERHIGQKEALSMVSDIQYIRTYESLSIARVSEHTRAYIKIQDGCNQFCSYCIIPFARGRVRSRSEAEICMEVEALVQNGYQEIVLTGIHISSYGLDFIKQEYNTCDDGEYLIGFIEKLQAIEGLKRIRLGSLEPRIITEAFVQRLAKLSKVCPHFHLSLQSGSDGTLARMNRRYTTGQYQEHCEILRKYFMLPAITTDVIVGFPGETNEEFEETKIFLQQIAFADLHIFKYSRREGTKADTMSGQVPEDVKTMRSHELIAIGEQMKQAYQLQWTGRESEVLLEEQTYIDGKCYMTGHTKEYIRVAILGEEFKSNQIIWGKLSSDFRKDYVICKSID